MPKYRSLTGRAMKSRRGADDAIVLHGTVQLRKVRFVVDLFFVTIDDEEAALALLVGDDKAKVGVEEEASVSFRHPLAWSRGRAP